MTERRLTYGAAIREALADALARDDRVVVLGQGVDDAGGIFGSTKGLAEEFGGRRVSDTPLSEEALTGIVNGAALTGLRPVLVHARVEFMLLALDPILNHAAKWRAMFGPDNDMPVVYRAVIGRGWGQGAQHSQSLPSLFMNVPGIRVAMPASPVDAKGLLTTAIREPGPVVVIEHRQLYGLEGPVPTGDCAVPFGRARVLRSGADVTVVAMSQMVHEALAASSDLEAEGVSVELIDPRTLVPFDWETVIGSVAKTGRLLVVENGWTDCGPSAEIVARVSEASDRIDWRGAPARLGFPPIPTPSSHVLEEAYYPHRGTIAAEVRRMMTGELRPTSPRRDERTLTESW